MSRELPDGREYEFTAEQNGLIGSLSGKMMFVGVVNVLFGLMYFGVAGLIALGATIEPKTAADKPMLYLIAAMYGVGGVVLLASGFWTTSAGGSFRGIATTRGRDISRLMDALASLHKMYALMRTLIVLMLVAGVGLVVAVVVAGVQAKG